MYLVRRSVYIYVAIVVVEIEMQKIMFNIVQYDMQC